MTTRTTEPTVITQGERIAWTKTIGGYSAEDYDLVYRFRSDAGPGFNVTATADGSAFDAVITAAVSIAAKNGKYVWQAWLTEQADATNTFSVGTGEMTIKQGFAADTTAIVDTRTPARICLDSIDAALASAASSDIQEYEISTPAGSRRVKRRTDLLEMRKYWASIVANEAARERSRKGGPLMPSIRMRVYDE